MAADRHVMEGPWSGLGRGELIALGRTLVTERLEALGCTVEQEGSGSKFDVSTRSGRELFVFVSTQRLGGYAFWTKDRFRPADDLLAAIVLLADDEEPRLYLLPSNEWLDAAPPFTDRDNVGKKSAPEFGVSLAHSSLPALEQFLWDDEAARELFR
jgi:hypothetical protein